MKTAFNVWGICLTSNPPLRNLLVLVSIRGADYLAACFQFDSFFDTCNKFIANLIVSRNQSAPVRLNFEQQSSFSLLVQHSNWDVRPEHWHVVSSSQQRELQNYACVCSCSLCSTLMLSCNSAWSVSKNDIWFGEVEKTPTQQEGINLLLHKHATTDGCWDGGREVER